MQDDEDRDWETTTQVTQAVLAPAALTPRSGQLTMIGGASSGRKFALGEGDAVIGRGRA